MKNAKYSCQQKENMMNNLIIKKEYRFPGSIWFKYVGEITEGEAMEFQKESGFHPHGYGFFGFICNNGISKWNCSNSCD